MNSITDNKNIISNKSSLSSNQKELLRSLLLMFLSKVAMKNWYTRNWKLESLKGKIQDPAIKNLVKYGNQTNILTLGETAMEILSFQNFKSHFEFRCVNLATRAILVNADVLMLRIVFILFLFALSAKPTKWSNTLKKFVGKLTRNFLGVFDHFVELALKGLMLQLVNLNFRQPIAQKYHSSF